ncbi:MAG: pyridoxal phosphate-dependent aminotransferase [Granulosicoccus sp.]|nr:pyridoxal phosphate-dependent aminotransferase [Granulosicoccus sp.]
MTSQFNAASRIDHIGVSEILQIVARARALKAEGNPVIALGAGEPDFDTPDNVKGAAMRAIEAGETKYTPLDGTLELKQAVQGKFARDNHLDYSLDEITTSAGAKQVLYNAFMATLNDGDEVIMPTPFWTSYADIVSVCGGQPVLVSCRPENQFLLTAEELEQAITPRTKWVLFNSPSNPSGSAYSETDYRPLTDVLLRYPDVWVMADDIYEHIVYDGFEFATPAQVEPRLKSRTLTVNGVSKAYAMTGWRLGYGGGPAELIKAMSVIQSQSTSCPSSVTQAAAIEALTGPQGFLKERADSFLARRDVVVNRLNAMEGIECPSPSGAFYTFAGCAGILGKRTPDGEVIQSDSDFCRLLLEQEFVAMVPGSAFGASPFFRASYATSMRELDEALDRIARFVDRLN